MMAISTVCQHAVLGQASTKLTGIKPSHARSSVSQGCDVDFLVLDSLQMQRPLPKP